MLEPQECTACESMFCGACIRALSNGKTKCISSSEMGCILADDARIVGQIYKDSQVYSEARKYVRSMLSEIKVYCQNKSSGCSQQVTVEQYAKHLAHECQYHQKSCPKCSEEFRGTAPEIEWHQKTECEGCKVSCPKCSMRSFDLRAHSEECAYALVRCTQKPEKCKARIIRKNLVKHFLKRCQYSTVQCPKCQEHSGLRGDLEKHLADDCPLNFFRCKYACTEAEYGRSALAQHYREACPEQRHRCEAACGLLFKKRNLEGHNCISAMKKALAKVEVRIAEQTKRAAEMHDAVLFERYLVNKPTSGGTKLAASGNLTVAGALAKIKDSLGKALTCIHAAAIASYAEPPQEPASCRIARDFSEEVLVKNHNLFQILHLNTPILRANPLARHGINGVTQYAFADLIFQLSRLEDARKDNRLDEEFKESDFSSFLEESFSGSDRDLERRPGWARRAREHTER
jgi:hypothetical protein